MPEKREVYAPYNFVPFSEEVLLPYVDMAELPGHDELREDLKSGEIQVTMQADTPVFVSNGEKEPGFFRGANGRFMIPGSTVRGMVRENMQILGFGLIRPDEDLEDYQLYYRAMVGGKGRITNDLVKEYRKSLGIESRSNPKSGKNIMVPTKVEAGYLCCRKGNYTIYPTAAPVMRVSRKMKDVQRFRSNDGSNDARVISVAYRAVNGVVKSILPAGEGTPDMQKGCLMYTGRPVKNSNPLYLFPEADTTDPKTVSPEDVLSYQEDLKKRANSKKAYVRFWALPKDGQEKPVFFAKVDGHLYFGMTLFLRIGYRNPVSAGLPKHHRETMRQIPCPLDYPHAILGFSSKTSSYHSRVSFGDFRVMGTVAEQEKVHMILSEPKPSYYPGYVEEGKNYNDAASENEEDPNRFRLRGYKQYWLKQVQPTEVSVGKERVGSAMRPLPAGTKFRGTIRFQNLTSMELGLLLWSLRLEEGCFQTIGMGKPYGYGRMRLTIDALCTADPGRLYGGDLTADPWRDESGKVGQYIDLYDSSVLGTSGEKREADHVRARQEIQDFFFIKRTVREGSTVSYMSLTEYTDAKTAPLPTVQSVREALEESCQPVKGEL